jgi:cytochrome P450
MSSLPPGPSRSPLLQLERWVNSPVEFMEECARRYGDAFTLRFPGNPPFILFSHPEAVREIFTADPDALHAGPANRALEAFLGRGSILLMDGQRHLRERRLMQPPFHGDRMRAYGAAMRDATGRAIAQWPIGERFPIHKKMQALTMEVILQTVLGIDSRDRLDRFHALLTRVLDLGADKSVLFFNIMLDPEKLTRLFSVGTKPLELGPLRIDWGRALPWNTVSRLRNDLDGLLYAELARRKAEGTAGREDILSMLLDTRDEENKAMSDGELRDELLTFLTAGHETSATTLSWTFHRVLESPEVHAKLREELRRVVGSGPLDPELVSRLEYLDATLKEAMRLNPITPVVGRMLQRPMRIGGWELPAGVNVQPCIYLTHRRPELWPEPERFHPDRFLGKRVSPYEYFPFGGGVRRCLGQAFSLYEMKIILAEIFRRVALRPAPGHTVRLIRRGLTFTPSEGMPVIVDALS